MSPTFERSKFGYETPFFLLATFSCFVSLLVSQDQHEAIVSDLAGLTPFIAFTLACSYFILQLVGYFDTIRLFPRKSDLILVMLAILLGGLSSCAVNMLLMKHVNPLLMEVTFLAPLASLLIFGIYQLIIGIRMKSGRIQRIVLDLNHSERALVMQDLASWGFLDKIEILSRKDLEMELLGPNPRSISLVIISPSTARSFEEDETILEAHLAGIPIADYRRICARLSGRIRLGHSSVWDYVLSATPQTALIRLYSGFKDIFEPILATFMMFALLPVFLFVAVLVKLSGPGPVLFSQTRVGHRQQLFKLIKFRTMNQDAESAGPRWCMENDARITTIGRFLRKTRLDELPQLWNVICGEMSFIGPRPEQPAIEKKLREAIPSFALRTLVRPGITGWAQVCSGYAASVEESKLKLEYDLFYIQNMSPRLDLIVILKTIFTAIRGDKKASDTVLVELPLALPAADESLFSATAAIGSRLN